MSDVTFLIWFGDVGKIKQFLGDVKGEIKAEKIENLGFFSLLKLAIITFLPQIGQICRVKVSGSRKNLNWTQESEYFLHKVLLFMTWYSEMKWPKSPHIYKISPSVQKQEPQHSP